MATDSPSAGYRFESFELYPAERRLLAQGRHVALGPRAFDLLVELVDRAGHLLTKDELLERVWPGVVVEENNLQVQISSLRKALGSAAIETVSGRGYRFTLAAARVDGGPAEGPTPRHHNLPWPLTRFVGHEADFDDYAQMLAETPLVTLTGVGGCGKTRLAVQLAFRLVPEFPDGVWFVDLAPAIDGARVPSLVATALGVEERASQPILDALLDYVVERRTLVVLDNCEHLVEACAGVAMALLRRAAGVKVLATSREPLGVSGERVVRVRSLRIPPLDAPPESEAIAAFEAVQLFVDRARLVDPRFMLDASRAPAVGEICRRLDGIPLAIELAAARTRVLSTRELRDRLDDRFRLLVAGDKSALPRQKTLLATMQWSYDLLAPDEAQLLRQLSVFAGGCTLEAATAVAGEGADDLVVLDRLTRLVDKSLVVARSDPSGVTRYSLLETVREFAHERLAEYGDTEAVRARHLDFFLALAEHAREPLDGPDQWIWLDRLDLERDNLLAAQAECGLIESRGEHGLRLIAASAPYWAHRGGLQTGLRMAGEALARPSAQEPTRSRFRALNAASYFEDMMQHHAEAQRYSECCLGVARQLGDDEYITDALLGLTQDLVNQGLLVEARGHAEEAVARARRLSQWRLLAGSLATLADLHRLQGQLVQAESLFEEALTVGRKLDDLWVKLIALFNLASVAVQRGRPKHAASLLLEVDPLLHQSGSDPTKAFMLHVCAGLASSFEDWERAARLHGIATKLSEQTQYFPPPPDEAYLAPLIARARDALGIEAFASAEGAGRTLPYEAAIAETRAWLERATRQTMAPDSTASR